MTFFTRRKGIPFQKNEICFEKMYTIILCFKSLKKLHQKIYEILPSEKYNPSAFNFHITIHIDKDYEKINKMKDDLLKGFVPFKLNINTFSLYEIYPAKLAKQFL